jgi:hypothetical protein
MENNIIINGNYVYILLQNNIKTKISLCNLNMANDFKGRWYAVYDKRVKNYYVYGHIRINDKKTTIKLHRYLKSVIDPKIKIDHINMDTLDNSDENLNIVTDSENKQNSKAKGYYFHKKSGKYVAQIVINKIPKYLGVYPNKAEAREVYILEKLKHHPYWASINKGATINV